MKNDVVNHPKHYTQGGVECIDALAAATVGLEGIEAVCTANAIKYLWRWKYKNGVEDIDKAIWYLNHLKEVITSPKEPITIDICDEELTIDDCLLMLAEIARVHDVRENLVLVCDTETAAQLFKEAIFDGRALTRFRMGTKRITRIHTPWGNIDITTETNMPCGSAWMGELVEDVIDTLGVFDGIEI